MDEFGYVYFDIDVELAYLQILCAASMVIMKLPTKDFLFDHGMGSSTYMHTALHSIPRLTWKQSVLQVYLNARDIIARAQPGHSLAYFFIHCFC